MDIGIIASVGYFLYGLGAFPAGYLADRFGSKRVLTVGILGMAFSSILVGLSPEAWTFGCAYALLGIFASIHHPAGLSLIARRVQEKKGKALGIHGVMGNVGLFLTPLFGAACIWLFDSWRSSYILFGVIGFFFAFLMGKARIVDEPDLVLADIFTFWRRRRADADTQGAGAGARPIAEPRGAEEFFIPLSLLALFAGSILSGFIFRGSLTYFPALFRGEIRFVMNHDFPVVAAGFLTTAVLSFGLLGAWFGGYINDKLKWPEFFPVVLFVCVAPLLYYISRFSDNRLIVVSCLFSLIYYAWQPSQNYLISKYSHKASHGKWFGVNFFLIFGIGSVATAIGGYVADDFGVDRFYWIMSLVAVASIAASAAVYLVRRYRLCLSLRLEREKASAR